MADILATLEAAEVPASRIYSIADIVADPHYAAREMIPRASHYQGANAEGAGRRAPAERHARGDFAGGGPALGEHTDAVLRELGYDRAAIRRCASAASRVQLHSGGGGHDEREPTDAGTFVSVGEAVQALDALLRNDLLPLCIVRDGWLTYGNGAFARAFALGTPGVARRSADLVVEEDRPAAAEHLAAIASGTARTARSAPRPAARPARYATFEFFGARRPRTGPAIAGLVLDVTERQRTQSRGSPRSPSPTR